MDFNADLPGSTTHHPHPTIGYMTNDIYGQGVRVVIIFLYGVAFGMLPAPTAPM